MKAFILAAGFGTRLRPLTDTVPKVMVPVRGKPLLEYNLDHMQRHGFNEVFINTHYLPEQVQSFVDDYTKRNPGMKVTVVYEPELLGSAGTVRANADFFGDDTDALVFYGDNLTTIDYKNLFDHHKRFGGLATISTWDEQNVQAKSMVVANEHFQIIDFIEKPKPEQVIVNRSGGGVFVINKNLIPVLQSLPDVPLDFGFHVYPTLIKEKHPFYEYRVEELLLDIGTPENYAKAQEIINDLEIYN